MDLRDLGQALVHGFRCLVIQVEDPIIRVNLVDIFEDFTAHLYYNFAERGLQEFDMLGLLIVAVTCCRGLLRCSEVLKAKIFTLMDLFTEAR